MSYSVYILKRAQKELAALPVSVYERIRNTILGLEDNARPHGCRKLTGRDAWRIRVGSYHIIYEINDDLETITIMHIGHRRDVYR